MWRLSGNKGEWSEVYVFLRLLEIGKLYAADADLNKMDDVFYNVVNIIRNEDLGKLEFRINPENRNISVYNCETESEISAFEMTDFKPVADNLYYNIMGASSASFCSEETEAFLQQMNVTTLKAKSTDKADIRIKIHDINTGLELTQGFSIKSRLGRASTLINAGKTTNFVFEVTGLVDDAVMNEFNTCSKLFKKRFSVLKEKNCDIVYTGMENGVFKNNLLLIDGDLPQICACMLKDFFSLGVTTIEASLDKITAENPLNYDLSNGHPFYRYKFKKLLTECALGMLPARTWMGTADATGGYIIVREDGEVLCYHLFNRNEFEDYLVKNTKFETGSTSRHDYGSIYKKEGKYFLKLNLQVRFVK